MFSPTYPGIVEAESEEGQLVVKVLVQLRVGRVNVLLVVAHLVVVRSLVEEPVEEVAADLSQALLSDHVTRSIVAISLRFPGRHSIFWI